jgi:hypothetical protein
VGGWGRGGLFALGDQCQLTHSRFPVHKKSKKWSEYQKNPKCANANNENRFPGVKTIRRGGEARRKGSRLTRTGKGSVFVLLEDPFKT